jgi:hypothetical protein
MPSMRARLATYLRPKLRGVLNEIWGFDYSNQKYAIEGFRRGCLFVQKFLGF